mgnify:CR=1 FL=1
MCPVNLPVPFKSSTTDEIALAVQWGERNSTSQDSNIVAHMAAELAHLREQRDALQRSNSDLLERARTAESHDEATLRAREYAIETIKLLTSTRDRLDRGDVDGDGYTYDVAGNTTYICDGENRVVFTSQGHYGTKADARALVTSQRGLVQVVGRLEPIAAENKRLRAELADWREVSDKRDPHELRDALDRLCDRLWAHRFARDVFAALTERVDHLVADNRRGRLAESDLRAARSEIERLREQVVAGATSAADERLRDSESKRDQWRERALAAESKVAEMCEIGPAAGDLVKARSVAHTMVSPRLTPRHTAQTAEAFASTIRALNRPKVGCAVFVRDQSGRLLMMRRSDPNGAGLGTMAVPGGHIEYGETPEQAMARELFEEAGITSVVRSLGVAPLTDMGSDGSYVTLYGVVDVPDGTVATNREPDKCEDMRWVTRDEFNNLGRLFEPLAKTIAAGIDPFTIQPTHPMLGAAVERIGLVDQASFVASKMGWR